MAQGPTVREIQEESRKSGESFAPSFDYEADMVRGSLLEQGYRNLARRSKGEDRAAYLRRAKEAHGEMQTGAEIGAAAREAERSTSRRKSAKRK